MPSRMMALFLFLACLGIGCRGVEKKSEVPHEEPVSEPAVEVLPIPEPAPVVEEPLAPTPSEPVVEPAPVEPEDPATVALRARIARLREERDKLRARKEDVFTRLPAKTDRRLDRLEHELDDAPDDAAIAPTEKEGER